MSAAKKPKRATDGKHLKVSTFLIVLGLLSGAFFSYQGFVWWMHGRELAQSEKRNTDRFDSLGARVTRLESEEK